MKIKICGLTRQADLDLAARLGADFCGFIFHSPSPRHIDPDKARNLASGNMKRTGVFVRQEEDEILTIMRTARLDYAQLHGGQSVPCARAIGPQRVIRVLWPERSESIQALQDEAARFADSCACYLLDAGAGGGGSGQTLDWKKLRSLRLPKPWFLAGGLDESNLAEALSQCAPWGIDLNSGLESSPGEKNPQKIRACLNLAASFKLNEIDQDDRAIARTVTTI